MPKPVWKPNMEENSLTAFHTIIFLWDFVANEIRPQTKDNKTTEWHENWDSKDKETTKDQDRPIMEQWI